MIVRISTEGQYAIEGADEDELNRLDNEAVAACSADDQAHFQSAFGELLDFVRTHGKLVDDDHLGGSDLILPPADVSLEEAKAEFSGEGLIPG